MIQPGKVTACCDIFQDHAYTPAKRVNTCAGHAPRLPGDGANKKIDIFV